MSKIEFQDFYIVFMRDVNALHLLFWIACATPKAWYMGSLWKSGKRTAIHLRGDARAKTKGYLQKCKRVAKIKQKLKVIANSDHKNFLLKS